MRLIPQKAMRYISDKALRDLWRDVMAMLGKNWQKENKNINYVWNHPYENLITYAHLIHEEGERRDIAFDFSKITEKEYDEADVDVLLYKTKRTKKPIYNEHNGNFVHLFCVRSELNGDYYWYHFPNTKRPKRIIGFLDEVEVFKKYNPGAKKADVTKKIKSLYDGYVEFRKMVNNDVFAYVVEADEVESAEENGED